MVQLLFVACLLLCAVLGVVAAVSWQAFRAYAAARAAFLQFITPAGEGKTSPLADTIDLAAQQLSARLSQTLLASFNGQASGMARGLKTVEADIATANLAQTGSPLAQIAGVLFNKQLRKNPLLMMALSNLAPGPAGRPADHQHSSTMLNIP